MMLKCLKQGFAFSLACGLFAASPLMAQSTAAPAPAAQKPAEAALPPAQAVIDRHIEAVGGRNALKAHTSVNIKGNISVPANGMNGSIEVFAARPNKMLSKTTLAGIGDVAEGFDGTVAWSMSPMTGPMLATGEELAQKAFDSNFDGAMGIASRYESMKTLEKTTFEGRPAYKLSLTRKGGGEDIEFYDVETGLKSGAILERKNPMGTITVTAVVSDYKRFGDLLQPTTLKQTMTGVQIITTFTSIEYDKVDPAVFELPAAIKALVK
jgi:hypothetical protein